MKSQAITRKFVKPKAISDYLKCPICLQVFEDAMRLYCGHTFCQKCLSDFMKSGKTCPECRAPIDNKNIGFDLLARQIINQIQVFCPQEDCPWKGIMQELQNHCVKQCMFFNSSNSCRKVAKNQKIAWHQTLDDQVIDKINEHTVKGSLQARILVKTDSIKQSIPLKQFKPSTIIQNTEQKLKPKRGKIKNKKLQQPKKQSRTSSFDFISSLFQ